METPLGNTGLLRRVINSLESSRENWFPGDRESANRLEGNSDQLHTGKVWLAHESRDRTEQQLNIHRE